MHVRMLQDVSIKEHLSECQQLLLFGHSPFLATILHGRPACFYSCFSLFS